MAFDSVQIQAIRRGGSSTDSLQALYGNERGELLVAQGLPAYAEMSQLGNGYMVQNTSALAGLVVRPSTTAGLTLWNGEAAGGKSYILDALMAFNLVTTAAISGYSMWICIHPVGMTAPTADITAIKSMSGRPSYAGSAKVDTGATVADDGWFPVGQPYLTGGVTTAPSGAMTYEPEGRFIVPPTAGVSIQVVSTITGLTFTHGFRWWEVQLTPNE